MEGLEYKQVAERENLSELSLKLRYTLNAKKVDVGKLKYDKHRLTIKRSYQKLAVAKPIVIAVLLREYKCLIIIFKIDR